MLIISVVLGLKTKSTDFGDAFAQAEMKGDPINISLLPRVPGFHKTMS